MSAASPMKSIMKPKALVSRLRPNSSTQMIDRREAKHAENCELLRYRITGICQLSCQYQFLSRKL